jgi:hypothetical protein
MLHLEFAIEPSQIKSIADLQLIESRFGYDKGALITSLPNAWCAEVLARLGHLDTQIGAITDFISSLKSKSLFRSQRTQTGADWLAIANSAHQAKPFHRVIEKSLNSPPELLSDINLLRDCDFSLNTRVACDASTLALASEALLLNAEKVTIVDPYLCINKAGTKKTLLEMMRLCQKGRVDFHVFSEENRIADWDRTFLPKLERLKNELPRNIKLHWYAMDDDNTNFLHQRSVFTGKGGLIYDRGFTEPNDHDQKRVLMPVQFMGQVALEQNSLEYNEASQSENYSICKPVWHS